MLWAWKTKRMLRACAYHSGQATKIRGTCHCFKFILVVIKSTDNLTILTANSCLHFGCCWRVYLGYLGYYTIFPAWSSYAFGILTNYLPLLIMLYTIWLLHHVSTPNIIVQPLTWNMKDYNQGEKGCNEKLDNDVNLTLCRRKTGEWLIAWLPAESVFKILSTKRQLCILTEWSLGFLVALWAAKVNNYFHRMWSLL